MVGCEVVVELEDAVKQAFFLFRYPGEESG